MAAKELLQQIASEFLADQELRTFCLAMGGRELKVVISHRNRAEIGSDELPLILLSSPSTRRVRDYGEVSQERTIRLFAGFYQPEPLLGALGLVEFEEQISAAIERMDLAGLGNLIEPLASINDEGSYQPNYFTAGEFTVSVNT
jgi:hypothetical protein